MYHNISTKYCCTSNPAAIEISQPTHPTAIKISSHGKVLTMIHAYNIHAYPVYFLETPLLTHLFSLGIEEAALVIDNKIQALLDLCIHFE